MISNETTHIKKQSKRNQTFDIIVQWCLSTTAHGFGNIVRAENFMLKIVWTVFLLASTAYCTYQVILSVIQFCQFEVITSSKIMHEAPTNFPAVVICNLNAYDGNVARDDMEQVLSAKNVTKDTYEPIDYVDIAADYFKSTFEANATRDEFNLFFNGFYLEQMLISCRYQGVKCDIDDFETYHDYNYGNCYRFIGKTSSIIKAKQPGWRHGLRLELYIGDLDLQQQYTYKAGMRVIIHNQSLFAFSDEDGLDIGVGQQTNIGITRTFISRQSYPYSNCIADFKSNETLKKNDFFSIILTKYSEMETYTQNHCLKICLQEYFIEKCNCYDLKLPRPDNTSSNNSSSCEQVNELVCLKDMETVFYNESVIDKCYNKCPNECYQVVYNKQITTAKYPSKWYTNILNNSTISYGYLDFLKEKNYLELQQSILMVNVYYENMYYTLLTESPAVTIEVLIAYIGGNFGLFIGISLLSLVEIIEVVFNVIFMCFKRIDVVKYVKHHREVHAHHIDIQETTKRKDVLNLNI